MNRVAAPTLLTAIVLLGAALGGWTAFRLWGTAQSPEVITMNSRLMGTDWSIQICPDPDMNRDQITTAMTDAFAEVSRVESVMSEWKADSPISKLNAAAGKPPRSVPDELRRILKRACDLSEQSQGAFDVTWKGLGNLWPLRDPDFVPPSAQAIDQARARVDYQGVVFQSDRVGLRDPDMVVGLGGIAKGYGLDQAASLLVSQGMTNFYLDGGGDILVSGQKNHRPWRIGIRHPRLGPDQLLAVVELSQGAVATSGDYERFREYQGTRYHHIIDPRSGHPARHCQSVTVIAPRAEMADALATAIFVLGPEEGLAMLRHKPGVEALVVDAQGALHMTPGFRSHATMMEPSLLANTTPDHEHF